MSTIPQESPRAMSERRRSYPQLLAREMWAGLAIVAIWLAVLFAAVFGPDIVTTNAGAQSAAVPSAVPVALFASLATWAVAKYGFGHRGRDAD